MRLHHLAFRTDDLPRLSHFYEHVLGLAVTRRTADRVWLDCDGTILMLEMRAPTEPGLVAGSLELVAFRAHPRIRLAELTIEARTPSTLYVRDPDGRRIGLSTWPELLPELLPDPLPETAPGL